MSDIKKSIQCTTAPFNEYLQAEYGIDFRLDEPQWRELKQGFFESEEETEIIDGLRKWWTEERETDTGVLGL